MDRRHGSSAGGGGEGGGGHGTTLHCGHAQGKKSVVYAEHRLYPKPGTICSLSYLINC